MKTQEQVFTSEAVLAEAWRSLFPHEQEGIWERLRQGAAEHAAATGKVLTDTPGERQVMYERPVTGPDGVTRSTECSPAEAWIVKLHLSCWAAKG